MTKKHFIALADVLAARLNICPLSGPERTTVQSVILQLADFCAAQNPQFNRERWLGYIAGTVGKNGGKVKA